MSWRQRDAKRRMQRMKTLYCASVSEPWKQGEAAEAIQLLHFLSHPLRRYQ